VSHGAGTDALVRMVNQIARNVSPGSPEVAASQTASHLNSFWAPSMRAALLEYVASGGAGLDDVALAALSEVR